MDRQERQRIGWIVAGVLLTVAALFAAVAIAGAANAKEPGYSYEQRLWRLESTLSDYEGVRLAPYYSAVEERLWRIESLSDAANVTNWFDESHEFRMRPGKWLVTAQWLADDADTASPIRLSIGHQTPAQESALIPGATSCATFVVPVYKENRVYEFNNDDSQYQEIVLGASVSDSACNAGVLDIAVTGVDQGDQLPTTGGILTSVWRRIAE